MKVKDIIQKMHEFAPVYLIDSWDNCGFQIGREDKEVKTILLAMDITSNIVKESIEKQVDMIITHHPFVFNPIKTITTSSANGKIIYDIIKHDIAIFSAHSNLDVCKNGVNDVLAEMFELKNAEVLTKSYEDEITYGYGRVGDLEKPINWQTFISIVKEKLECDSVRFYGDTNKTIRRVAICGGSGSDSIKDAKEKNADIYVTADIKFHEAQDAIKMGLNLIDANHFNTEKVILPHIKEYLHESSNQQLKIIISDENSAPFIVY